MQISHHGQHQDMLVSLAPTACGEQDPPSLIHQTEIYHCTMLPTHGNVTWSHGLMRASRWPRARQTHFLHALWCPGVVQDRGIHHAHDTEPTPVGGVM